MNPYKDHATDRAVSSEEWIEKSTRAGFAAIARAKKRQEADAEKYAQIEKERQEYGVFLEIRNGKNRECVCSTSVAAQLSDGKPIFFSKPSLENAAKLLRMKLEHHDEQEEVATMTDEYGKTEVYQVKESANMLRIQILKAAYRLPVCP